ncbi:MAG: Uma2 family endonuclease [Xanthomonadaceae bacterium]|nr:Uma2 family endonuclease [Xanthomonadaceae bacterium]
MSTRAQDILQRHRLNVDEYHRMGRAGILPEDSRVELINGEIIDTAPIGSRHAAAVKQLMRLLDRGVGDHAIVSVQDPIQLDDHTEPQPDLALLRPRTDYYKTARAGIPEAWLVDLGASIFARYHEAGPDGYHRNEAITDLQRVGIATLPGVALDLHGLF